MYGMNELEIIVIQPTFSEPLYPWDEKWEWPKGVNTPYRYGQFVRQLQEWKGHENKFPIYVFSAFASQNKHLGYECLTRAACMATLLSQHPFSHKHIEKFLDQVPESQKLSSTFLK